MSSPDAGSDRKRARGAWTGECRTCGARFAGDGAWNTRAAHERACGALRAAVRVPSRFRGVCWDKSAMKWKAYYRDADGNQHSIGLYDDEEEAARARDKAIRDAGLQGERIMNAVDATSALVPTSGPVGRIRRDRSAVVAPDPARDPTETTSKFWGVTWDKGSDGGRRNTKMRAARRATSAASTPRRRPPAR